MSIISFVLGIILASAVMLPYCDYQVRKYSARAYTDGFMEGVGLRKQADDLLNER